MTAKRLPTSIALLTITALWAAPALAEDDALSSSDTLMRALVDEMQRSMDLQMEDLEKPYFIQYNVDDTIGYDLYAQYGAVTSSSRERSRRFTSRVRVGSYELDNTNFADMGGFSFFGGPGGGGGRASLPLDDNYLALRQAIWRATDGDYKSAVETLTKKRAYMEDKTIEDRPDDFSEADPVEHVEPAAVLRFDRKAWEENLGRISAHFKKYDQVQDSSVRLFAAAGDSYVVTSEGTRVRFGDVGALLLITAEGQAEDGMRLSTSRSYTGQTTDDFPPVDKIIADIDQSVAELTEAMKAETIEQYTGPVLFDDVSAPQMLRVMLAEGLVGKPDQVGEQRRQLQGTKSLEKKLGTRILPKSFLVWDDPAVKTHADQFLLGHYRFDSEGVPAQRVDLVTKGKLEQMCLSRAPTKKLSGSNGHARTAVGGGDPQPAIGCLFVQDDKGLPADELKEALIQLAKDNDLEYAVRVKSVKSTGITSSRSDILSFFMRAQNGGGSTVGDPVVAYKVYVDDGREEPFRGCEFGQIEVTTLKRIAAAGETPTVYNYISLGLGGASPPSTIIAPPMLFEELDLSKIEQEHDKLPILKAPLLR